MRRLQRRLRQLSPLQLLAQAWVLQQHPQRLSNNSRQQRWQRRLCRLQRLSLLLERRCRGMSSWESQA